MLKNSPPPLLEVLKMLMTGDLVKVPQRTRLFTAESDSWKLKVLAQPEIAIILKTDDEESTILWNDGKWKTKTKNLKLYWSDNVC